MIKKVKKVAFFLFAVMVFAVLPTPRVYAQEKGVSAETYEKTTQAESTALTHVTVALVASDAVIQEPQHHYVQRAGDSFLLREYAP